MIYQPVSPYLANNTYYQSPYQQRLTTIEQTQSNIPMAASGVPQPTNFLKELEAYMQELSTDVTEMIKDASPEEKAILRQKMTTLASKIA